MLQSWRVFVSVQGGVQGPEIQVAQVLSGGRGIVFAPSEGNARLIKDVYVTHITVSSVSGAASLKKR